MAEEHVPFPSVPRKTPQKYGDIFLAAEAGDAAAVKEFAENEKENFDANKTSSDTYPRTAFSIACEHNRLEVAKYLLERGADPGRDNEKENINMTQLHWAAQKGHIDMVNLLVNLLLESRNRNIAVRNDLGKTALLLAVESGRDNVVELLGRAAPHTLDYADIHGKTPLMAAADQARLGIVSGLLERAKVNPVRQDENRTTPLVYALLKNDGKIVSLLTPYENTSLHLLVTQTPIFKTSFTDYIPRQVREASESGNGYLLLAKSLLLNGYNVNTKNEAGITPIQLAVRNKCLESVDFLLHEHASIEGISADEWRALLLTPEAGKATLLITRESAIAVTTNVAVQAIEELQRREKKGMMHVIPCPPRQLSPYYR